MFARLVMFKVAPGHRREVEALADEVHAYMKLAHGYQRAEFFLNEKEHEYGGLSVWDSMEDIEHVAEVLNFRLHKVLKGIAEGAPSIHTYEVYTGS